MAICPHCYGPIPDGSRKTYCSTRCRRDAQNERRREERAEAAELREAERNRPMADPWSRSDFDDMSIEEILAASLIDCMPAMYDTTYDKLQRAYRTLQDKELAKPQKMVQGWLM
jgi:hypothetical protein